MMKEDYELIGRSLVDVVAEPYRADLIPGFHRIKKIALHNGALGCGISGSGPTLFAYAKLDQCRMCQQSNATRVSIIELGQRNFLISEVNREGAQIIEITNEILQHQ